MTLIALALAGVPALCAMYAFALYPWALRVAARFVARRPLPCVDPHEWPMVSVCLPVHNEERQISGAIEALLSVDYPSARMQVVVVSDASTDRTDDMVRRYRGRGVELLRLSDRRGKTAAEQQAVPRLKGSIVVNTDASTRVLPDAIKPLVRAFGDPSIGVASATDVSFEAADAVGVNVLETGYTGREMAIRRLETRVGGIVGASGCCYAARRELHAVDLPDVMSRDFATVLVARENGFRSVSVDAARCLVPRTSSLREELRRKQRTMAQGIDTLWRKRALLSPSRHGAFSLKLASHKVARWLATLSSPLSLVGIAILGFLHSPLLLVAAGMSVAMGALAFLWPDGYRVPRPIAMAGYILAIGLAAGGSWLEAMDRRPRPLWEPTRR